MSCKYKNDIFVKICQKKNTYIFFINILKLLNTDIIVTPTSAKTAKYIGVIPIIAKININNLKLMANIILLKITLLVNLLILIAFVILLKSSFIKTISLASTVASLPIFPIAIPMSDNLITGASFIPSPTNAV